MFTEGDRLAVREFLAAMSFRELQQSLEAFPRLPSSSRPIASKCFLGCAFTTGRDIIDFLCGLRTGRLRPYGPFMEYLYEGVIPVPEGTGAEWLHGEVLRELAERGAAQEAVVTAAVTL